MLHLTVNTLASTARAWLVPRLKSFHDAHPKITLQLQTDYALINPAPNLATLAIRHGPPFSRIAGNESLYSELLFPETLLAVTSPELAQQFGEDPTLWESSAMLRHTSLDWSIWFDGIAIARTDAACGAAFNDASVLLDAAAAGLGVALTRYSLAYPRLLDGTLLAAAPQRCVSPSSHYLVCRKDCLALPAVAAFVTWLRQEAKTWTSLPLLN